MAEAYRSTGSATLTGATPLPTADPPLPFAASVPISLEAAEAIADDAEALAALHDRELTPGLAAALREAGFPAGLGLIPSNAERLAAWQAMSAGVTSLPAADGDVRAWDDLAAEYAAIYLTGAYGASPYESVWTDDDHLTCQGAMFELRAIYARAGLHAANWRQRADDHLVLQLQYVAHAVRHAESQEDWRALAQVLDEHLLRWLPDFASRIALRSPSPFYVGLAVLTAAWVDALRDLIASTLNEPRPTRLEVEERLHAAKRHASAEAAPMHFVPGAGGPSW